MKKGPPRHDDPLAKALFDAYRAWSKYLVRGTTQSELAADRAIDALLDVLVDDDDGPAPVLADPAVLRQWGGDTEAN